MITLSRSLCAALASLALSLHAAQTGTPRRLLAADYSTKRLGLVAADGTLEWQYPIQDIHDAAVLPNGHLLFQTNWTHLVEFDGNHQIAWSYDAGKQNGNGGKRVEVHAFQRLPDGLTMIAESGPGRLIEVDREGRIQHEIHLKLDHPDPHRDTRLARKLDTGNYLVAQEGDAMVREYDGAGKVVWEYDVRAHVYSASRLANGHTLIGCGDGHRVVEVDAAGRQTWSVEEKDLPGVTLAWITCVDRLSNGNTIIVNCHAGPDNPQMIEVTPAKQVVWSFKDFTQFGNAMPVALILPPRRSP